MANTRLLTVDVERHVRAELAQTYGPSFEKRRLPLSPGGDHEFDAVSTDGTIVASIKSHGGKTASGRHPAGKVTSAIAELYFLSLVSAPTRLLVLTSAEFHEILTRTLRRKIAPGIDILLMPLPSELQRRVDEVQRDASTEVTPVLDAAEQSAANHAD